jgi:hypothetical protein
MKGFFMKIKLMIVALVVVSGLRGMDTELSVSVKDQTALTKAFERCVASKSYGFKDSKRPIVFCCLQETDDKKTISCLIQKAIDKGQIIHEEFSWLRHIKAVDGVAQCTIYNIGCKKNIKEDLFDINQLMMHNQRTPLLFVATSSDLKSICEELGADIQSCDNVEFASALLESAKELARDEMDNVLTRGASLDELSKKSEELSFQSKVFQFNKDKKQPSFLSAFSNFFTNHWGKLAVGGVSLAALFAYYYKFVR